MIKKIVDKKWDNGNKFFSVINYKKSWKENNNKPRINYHTNGTSRKNGGSCLDVTLTIGYIVFNYTNFNFLNRADKKLGQRKN